MTAFANVYGELWPVWHMTWEKTKSILKYKNWVVVTAVGGVER